MNGVSVIFEKKKLSNLVNTQQTKDGFSLIDSSTEQAAILYFMQPFSEVNYGGHVMAESNQVYKNKLGQLMQLDQSEGQAID